MKVGDKNALDISAYQGSSRVSKKNATEKTEVAQDVNQEETVTLGGKVKPYTEEIKEIKMANSAIAHLGAASNSLGGINSDGMEGAMEGLRSIAASLKEVLNKNIKAMNDGQVEPRTYSVDEVRQSVTKPAFASSHNYAYLADRVDSLLA